MSDPILTQLRRGRAEVASLRDDWDALAGLIRQADAAGVFGQASLLRALEDLFDGDDEDDARGWEAYRVDDAGNFVKLTQQPEPSPEEAVSVAEAEQYYRFVPHNPNDDEAWVVIVCRVGEDPAQDGIPAEEIAARDRPDDEQRRSMPADESSEEIQRRVYKDMAAMRPPPGGWTEETFTRWLRCTCRGGVCECHEVKNG